MKFDLKEECEKFLAILPEDADWIQRFEMERGFVFGMIVAFEFLTVKIPTMTDRNAENAICDFEVKLTEWAQRRMEADKNLNAKSN